MKFYIAIISVLCSVFLLEAQQEQTAVPYQNRISVNSLLATIDGEPITLLDVMLEDGSAERELAGLYTGERLNREIESRRRATLEKIIDRKLIYKEYLKKPFEITRQTVEDVLDRIAATFGGRDHLEDKLKADGMTVGALKRQIRERIAVDIILARNCDIRAAVTPKEVYDEYLKDSSAYTEPEKISFQIIQIDKTEGQNAAAIAEKLTPSVMQADETLFQRLAAEYSDGIKGIAADMSLDGLRPAFRDAMKDKAPGTVTGPVDTPEAVFFLRISGRRAAMRIPFEQVSQKLYDTLLQKKTEEIRREYRKRLRAKAMIRYYI